MFGKVVAGFDGHEGGRDAVALARNLLAPGGELTLAHVYPGDTRIYRSTGGAYEAVEGRRAHDLLERARADAGIEADLRSRQSASAGQGLHELCELIGADLLVVGSSRRGFLGRVFIGDDTRAALDRAPCAVAIAPVGYSAEPVAMREVGVAYDGSPESEHALEIARRIAAGCRAKVSAFEAVSLRHAFVSERAPGGEAPESQLDESRGRIETLGEVEPHAAYGRPAEELTLYSASLDLLVIGSRDYGRVGRLVHGSTARQLVGQARCPLLILTRAARAPAASGNAKADPAHDAA